MEHQVQGLVLVDNEWVSRPHDVYQIMAAAQHEDIEMHDAIAKPTAQVPEYGILSRTLLSTPLTKFILPANIRHKHHTDVVLVGEDTVQLKEVRDYGHLRHVATKSNFNGARILAAKVFGDPREVPTTRAAGGTLPKKHALHRERRSMTGDDECLLPPEVIVLTLTTRTLMFLWARPTQTGAVAFSQKTIRLPAATSRIDRFGTFLAIDPKCRAMAVAAHDGRFILYQTKTMEMWRAEVRKGSEATPIVDERIISIDGRIMHMSFLSSGGGLDDYHVVLLFIIAHQGKTKITCFDWDCRQDLSKATARTERVLVEFEDHNPSLLIPLSRSPDFLLVFDTHISVYRDILSGLPIRTSRPIDPRILAPLNPGDSKSRPKWVGWDKTPRNPEFPKEVFYIAREDGRIIYAERGSVHVLDVNEAGEWPYRIDTAFACLSVDNSEFSQLYPDVLIAGGAGNDGLLCKVGSWPTEYSYTSQYSVTNQITYIESIPNWSPLSDLAVTRLRDSKGERERSTIFVANGNSPHGEVSELRHGLQASVDDSFSGMSGCTGLWVVDYGSLTVEIDGTHKRQHYATFVITLPMETLVIRIYRTQPESRGQYSGAWEYGVWNKDQVPSDDEPIEDGVMRSEETISACHWSDTHSIQVTRHEARILIRPSLRQHASVVFNTSLLLAASVPTIPYVVIAYREMADTYLELVQISQDITFERAQNTRIQLAHDPTCLEILDIDGITYVFVSTFDSQIQLLRLDGQDGASQVLEASLKDITPNGSHMLCESAVVLLSRGQPMLVCTTRDGLLLNTVLTVDSNSELDMGSAGNNHWTDTATPRLSWRCTRMGTTSAQIRQSQTDKTAAFVSCGPDFCRVRCSANDLSVVEIDSVWFTDRANPAYLQSSITAMYQLPFLIQSDSGGRNLGGFLFAVAGDQLLFSQLDSDIRWSHDTSLQPEADSGAVPRKLITSARPTSVVYFSSLRRMIISTIEAKEEQAPPKGYRVLHSTLKVLNMTDDKPLDEPDIKPEDGAAPHDRLIMAQCQLDHAERVHCIVDWPFVDHHGKEFGLIIVGTSVQTGLGKSKGRRLIFSTGKSRSKLQLQKDSVYDQPVYAIAMWSSESIIMAVGKTLSFEVFDSQAGRWFKRGSRELPSPGLHITAEPPFVYVSTQQHSHICYKIVDSTREGKFEFEQIFTDNRERSCTQHLVLDLPAVARDDRKEHKLVLLADKGSSSIAALRHPAERSYRNAADTVFEANLPHSVVRLQRGNIRPPWRRPTHSKSIAGVLADDVIGACTDGTIYTFSVLSLPARHFLRFLQNLIEAKQRRDPAYQHTTVRPRSGQIFDILMNGADGSQDGKIRARDVDPQYQERGQAGPRHKHIDGDLLSRWVDEGGSLENLVLAGKDTERDVEALFTELALRVDAKWAVRTSLGPVRAGNVLKSVRAWMSDVLMPVL